MLIPWQGHGVYCSPPFISFEMFIYRIFFHHHLTCLDNYAAYGFIKKAVPSAGAENFTELHVPQNQQQKHAAVFFVQNTAVKPKETAESDQRNTCSCCFEVCVLGNSVMLSS